MKEGESAVLTCQINKADAEAVWRKDGEKITVADTKYTMTVDNYTHTLCIADCDIDDDAEYTITVEDNTSAGNVFVEGESFTATEWLPQLARFSQRYALDVSCYLNTFECVMHIGMLYSIAELSVLSVLRV